MTPPDNNPFGLPPEPSHDRSPLDKPTQEELDSRRELLNNLIVSLADWKNGELNELSMRQARFVARWAQEVAYQWGRNSVIDKLGDKE